MIIKYEFTSKAHYIRIYAHIDHIYSSEYLEKPSFSEKNGHIDQMLKITAEEIHFIIYQYLHESGKKIILSQRVSNSPFETLQSTIDSQASISPQEKRQRLNWAENNVTGCRIRTHLIYLRPGGEHARKPIQRVPDS